MTLREEKKYSRKLEKKTIMKKWINKKWKLMKEWKKKLCKRMKEGIYIYMKINKKKKKGE